MATKKVQPVLYKEYQNLNFPYAPLCKLPTPIIPLTVFNREVSYKKIYMKQDGLTGPLYGGNKIRKLEFLLGEALAENKDAVLTFGAIGSNHALATALYAGSLGLKAHLMLAPQHITPFVLKNLLLDYTAGPRFHLVKDFFHMDDGADKVCEKWKKKTGKLPYVIPPGGSSPVGTLGYVNAAFELKAQIEDGLLPEPDIIYLPLGTAGTAGGLILGLKAAGLKCRVRPVQVVDPDFTNKETLLVLIKETNKILHDQASDFPLYNKEDFDISICMEQFGEGYGIPTDRCRDAVTLLGKTEKIHLETTYSGKALAGLIAEADKNKTVLFWNTYNGVNFIERIRNIDYKKLPEEFHSFFEGKIKLSF